MKNRFISLTEGAVLFLVATLLVTVLVLMNQEQRARQQVLDRSLASARILISFAQEAQHQYTNSISASRSDADLTVADEPGVSKFHFPATLLRNLTERFSEKYPQVNFSIFSGDPFETSRDRELDGFQRDALVQLERGGARSEYWTRVADPSGKSRLRMAVPIIMGENCVACHNDPKWKLAKTDWSVGDMRGVQEVILDIPHTALQTHLQFYSLWAAIAVSCSLGLFLVLPAVRERGSERKEYEGLSEELHQQAVEFETQSLTDFQTGLCNRSRFEELLTAYVGEFQKQNVPLGLMIFDIDHCSAVNENHGQQVGDQMVVEVAKLLKTHVRQEDFAARIGGDEFAVVIPNIPRETLLKRAQFLGHEASNLSFQTDNGPVTITVSGGVSSLMPNDTVATFRQRADDGLVFAKNSGRNKVCA